MMNHASIPAIARTAMLSLATGAAILMLLCAPASAAITLGSTTIGVSDDGDSNSLNGSKVTVGSTNAQVSSISVYVGNVDTAPNNSYQVGIYTNNGSVPGTLLVASSPASLTPNAWNTVAITATLQANTSYWLIYNSNGRTSAVNNMSYTLGSGGQGVYSSGPVPFGTFPTNFGAATLTAAVYALYATADTGGPDPRGTVGEWGPVMNWPLIAIHSNLLKTGKVLVWDEELGVTNPKVWDPASQILSDTPLVGSELFCAGHTQLANGNLFVAGGHEPNQGEVGTPYTYEYLPDANTWIPTADMLYDRWYPAVTKLSDGRAVIFSGQITDNVFADTPEMFDSVSGVMTQLNTITTPELREEEYPINFLLTTGKVLSMSPEHGAVQLFDAGATSWTNVTTTPITLGSAVQYRPGIILMTGGGSGFFATSVGTAAVLDMNAPTPSWRSTNPMSLGRYMHNLVMLPMGDVLAVGGSSTVYQQAASGPLPVELWSADTETWATLSSLATPRMYHSTALLVPDGRVLVAGGGRNGAAPNYPSAQVFSPPYLFRGARPTVASAPGAVAYGAAPFVVTTPDAANISKVSLIGMGSVTHSTDMNQSYTELVFTPGAGQLSVTPPANSNQVPPGFYMLFIVDADRVPSIAKIIQVGGVSPPTPTPTFTAVAPPPTATRTSTASVASPTATRTSTVAAASPTATRTSTVAVGSPTSTPVSSTLGLTTVGSNVDDGDSNHLNGSRITVGPTGVQVTSISVYVGNVDTSPNNSYQVAIYTNNGGVPGTLMVSSPSATLAANAWNTTPLAAALQANTSYWLMYNSNGRTAALNNMTYNLGSPGQGAYSSASTGFGTWPASFGPATITNAVYALYATVNSGAAPSPTATVGVPSSTPTRTSTAAVPSATATRTSTVAGPTPTRTPVSTPLGLTTIGTIADDGDSHHLNGSRVLTAAGGQIVSMSVYVGSIDAAVANRSYQMAIYTDSAARPGTLVATTAAGTLIANSWNTLPITATLQASTNFWLLYNTNGGSGAVNNMRYNGGAAGQGVYGSNGVTFGSWPSTFPASTLTNAVYSLYASFGP